MTIDFDFALLSSLGLTPALASRALQLADDAHMNPGSGRLQLVRITEVHRETDQGYVTSVCWSPTLGSWLGLAFLKDGRARYGEKIRLVDHLRGLDVICEVTNPVFHDPEGEKLRA